MDSSFSSVVVSVACVCIHTILWCSTADTTTWSQFSLSPFFLPKSCLILFRVTIFQLKIFSFCTGWCGSVEWAPPWKPKGHWFDSQSGHVPGLWARSPVGGMWEATTHCCFSPSLPLPLSLKINTIFRKKFFPALTGIAQLVRLRPAKQKVTGLIPSQGTCLGCQPSS